MYERVIYSLNFKKTGLFAMAGNQISPESKLLLWTYNVLFKKENKKQSI